MTESIKLTEEDFELPESIHYDEDVVLGIRLFNLTLAKKVMKQILENQNKAHKFDGIADEYNARFLYILKLENENKSLKEKLENSKEYREYILSR